MYIYNVRKGGDLCPNDTKSFYVDCSCVVARWWMDLTAETSHQENV